MKIIQVSPYYFPHLGGLENCVKEISERLVKNGHQVEVFTSDIGSKKVTPKSNSNLTIHYLKALEFAHTPIVPSLFIKLLTVSKDTIIHLHIAQAGFPEVVWLISKVRSIPYIAHVHVDIEPTGKMGFLLPPYKKILLKKVLKDASSVIVPTKDYVDIIGKKYDIPKSKIIVIPLGVDLNNFSRTSIKLHNPIRLLFVGRLTKQKNIPLLIQSLKNIVNNEDFNVELHIVGEGEENNNIVLLIKKLKLDNNIVMHGSLRGKSLYKLYSNSDIFTLPSIYESFGIVLIEAMASGLPIIVSNIPAVRDVVKNNKTGLLVKLTPNDFSEAIKKLLKNTKLREKLIENSLKEVRKYNWNQIVSKFEKVYGEVIYETK